MPARNPSNVTVQFKPVAKKSVMPRKPPGINEVSVKRPCQTMTAENGTVVITLAQNPDIPLAEARAPAASAASHAHTAPE